MGSPTMVNRFVRLQMDLIVLERLHAVLREDREEMALFESVVQRQT